jgi:hypothetical protein
MPSVAIQDVLKRLLGIQKKIEVIIITEIKNHKDLIAQLNRDQLMAGKTADGEQTPKYVQGSKQPSAPGNMNFFDTGAYQKGIKAIFKDEGIEMTSTDFKNAFLNPYKKSVETLGLTDESIAKLQAVILPNIISKIRKHL